MRVYELMAALAKMPAAASVKFFRLATKEELPKYPDEQQLHMVDFVIREVTQLDDNVVTLDGWAE